jgi:hypothetical protein
MVLLILGVFHDQHACAQANNFFLKRSHVFARNPGESTEKQVRMPVPELFVGSMDLSLNGIRLAQESFPGITGAGLVLSVKEESPDTADLDIRGRFLLSDFASSRVNGHATLMSTIIAGAGNSWHLGRGAARGAMISSADYSNLFPEPLSYYQSSNISVQNHSYGVGIESFYGADAAAYDASVISLPGLLHVFSSGNRGNGSAATGPFQGINGFANLTGSFKMAKNAMVVGAVDSFLQVEQLSSRGPAHDGRVKPELVAFGEDGSSGAAALVSGTALLMQEIFRQREGSAAPAALLRSILVNSADDLGTKAVDYVYGFGNLNAFAALQTIRDGRFHNGSLPAFGQASHDIPVPGGAGRLKVSLAWNDPPAAPNATKALIHDLDLMLVNKSTGETWLPWVLSAFPQQDSLRRPALRGRDSLNNIEQVTLDMPDSGVYEIRVRAGALPASQAFHIAWQVDSADTFQWLYPLRNDPVEAGKPNLLRWKTGITPQTGTLEYSTDLGNSWTLAADGVNLSQPYLRWQSPVAMGPLLLRMHAGSRIFYSDTVVLSRRPEPVVGFSCADSFYVHWTPFTGASAYRIYSMGPAYLQAGPVFTDTMAVLPNAAFPGNYLAIEPIFSGFPGQRSYTFNHADQGVQCYIRSFRGIPDQDAVLLLLALGTQYQLQRITWEKWNGSSFVRLSESPVSDKLELSYTDRQLVYGVNRYRVRLDISGGRTIYSEPEDVFYNGNAGHRIYPSLVRRGSGIQLAFDNITDEGTVQVVDMQGRMLYRDILRISPQRIPTEGLASGSYIILVYRNGKQAWTGRFTVL